MRLSKGITVSVGEWAVLYKYKKRDKNLYELSYKSS